MKLYMLRYVLCLSIPIISSSGTALNRRRLDELLSFIWAMARQLPCFLIVGGSVFRNYKNKNLRSPPAMFSLLRSNSLDAYILMNTSSHLTECVPDSEKRVEKISGFSGSNATLFFSLEEKLIFTDGRYFIQAQNELKNGFSLAKECKTGGGLLEHINTTMKPGSVIGVDARLVSHSYFSFLKNRLMKCEMKLVDVEFDDSFLSLPKKVFNPVYDIDDEFTGIDKRTEKMKRLRNMFEDGEVIVITELDSIAWLFNLRGADFKHSPLFYSYAYISKDEAKLFLGVDEIIKGYSRTVDDEHFNVKDLPFFIEKYENFESFISLMKDRVRLIIAHDCSERVAHATNAEKFVDFIGDLMSVKSENELIGFRKSCKMDGVALCSLFGWMISNVMSGGSKSHLTEADVAWKLEDIKRKYESYISPSFETICGSGENGAIIHHSAGDRQIRPGELIVFDSGSQYIHGTTDVTRTIICGEPTTAQKKHYTLVLKGFLRAKAMVFPKSMDMARLEVISRLDLWKEFLEFEHSVSHGVGYFSCVHERIPRNKCGIQSLKPGNVITIEPGFYKCGEYGIRIEDMVCVKACSEDGFFSFNDLTCVPLHIDLIDSDMLGKDEIEMINQYSRWVKMALRNEISTNDSDGIEYLINNTREIR